MSMWTILRTAGEALPNYTTSRCELREAIRHLRPGGIRACFLSGGRVEGDGRRARRQPRRQRLDEGAAMTAQTHQREFHDSTCPADQPTRASNGLRTSGVAGLRLPGSGAIEHAIGPCTRAVTLLWNITARLPRACSVRVMVQARP